MNEETVIEAPTAPRRSRAGVVIVTVTGILVVGAVFAGAVGVGARSTASDDRTHAASAITLRRASAKRQHAVDETRAEIRARTQDLPDRASTLGSALYDMVTAHNRFIGVVNRAAGLYNSGDSAGASALHRSDGATELQTMADTNARLQQTMNWARAALQSLQEAL